MENTKYYTPELEEFHIGFEYEIFRDSGNYDYWDKTKENLEVHELSSKLNSGGIRVKYLDKEDIESLGWIDGETKGLSGYLFNWEDENNNFQMYEDRECTQIYDWRNEIIFQGTIKNKSELKRLMQQLNIK